jgi:hypothetical protein
VTALPDGTYDAFVIDARDDGTVRHLDLTIVAGEHKGEVVSIATNDTTGQDIDVMGLPATLVVHDGRPSVTLEP